MKGKKHSNILKAFDSVKRTISRNVARMNEHRMHAADAFREALERFGAARKVLFSFNYLK